MVIADSDLRGELIESLQTDRFSADFSPLMDLLAQGPATV
jgi:hypothetical protein